jgi:hypothetical protein
LADSGADHMGAMAGALAGGSSRLKNPITTFPLPHLCQTDCWHGRAAYPPEPVGKARNLAISAPDCDQMASMHRPVGQPAERNHSTFLGLATHYVGRAVLAVIGRFAIGVRG